MAGSRKLLEPQLKEGLSPKICARLVVASVGSPPSPKHDYRHKPSLPPAPIRAARHPQSLLSALAGACH